VRSESRWCIDTYTWAINASKLSSSNIKSSFLQKCERILNSEMRITLNCDAHDR